MNDSDDAFDDAGLRIAPSDEVPFKEAVMLVCRWWYPTSQQPSCVVDAIHVTRAEPTANGVAIAASLRLIAKHVAAQGGAGVHVTGQSVSCSLEGPELLSALAQIEEGIDPLYARFKSDKNVADALSANVAILAAVYERSSLAELVAVSQCQGPPSRL